MDWECFIALYVIAWEVDRPDLGGFLALGGRPGPPEIPDLAYRLLDDGYDSPSLRLAAGEDWRAAGITDLFDKALHEIGFLPMRRTDAALTLIREAAGQVIDGEISEHSGISHIWGIMDSVPELRKTSPFDEISMTEDNMYHRWRYHEERNRSLAREYAAAIIKLYGKRAHPGTSDPGNYEPPEGTSPGKPGCSRSIVRRVLDQVARLWKRLEENKGE